MTDGIPTDEIVSAHRKQMSDLIQEHQKEIEAAQQKLESFIFDANKKLQDMTLHGMARQEPVPETPQAVWSGEYLVLNKSAAGLIEKLLAGVGDVLGEIGRVLPAKK